MNQRKKGKSEQAPSYGPDVENQLIPPTISSRMKLKVRF